MNTLTKPEKQADTDYPVHDIIKNRWSPRSFADQEVTKETIRNLFDAARWAPSSYNEQPWRFIYARKEETDAFEQLSSVMGDFNKKWATDAPLLILTIVKENFSNNDSNNRVAEYDLGAAMSYLTFEATRQGLYVHQMAGIDLDKARELYGIPEGYKPWTMAAVGYKGDPDDLPEDLLESEKSERSRKEIDEIAFQNNWKGD